MASKVKTSPRVQRNPKGLAIGMVPLGTRPMARDREITLKKGKDESAK